MPPPLPPPLPPSLPPPSPPAVVAVPGSAWFRLDRQQEERSAISEYRGGLEERLDEGGRKEGGDKEGERREEETERSMRTLTISVNLFFDV